MITTRDLARTAGVTSRTAQRWARQMGAGRLGRYVVSRVELVAWLYDRRNDLPADTFRRLRRYA